MRISPAAVVIALCWIPAVASGHTLLVDPQPRNMSDGLKTGPCGGVAPTAAPTELAAGATITVRWLETIDHPGYYRIAFSRVGDTGFDDNVLLDEIPDVVCGAPPCEYSAEVTLPSEACEGCSLQIIQFMGTAPPYSPYFSCADIALTAGPSPDAGPLAPDAGPAPDAVDQVPDEGDAGVGVDEGQADLGGGCSATGSRGGGVATLLVFVFAFALALRRRSRVSSRRPTRARR